MGARALGFIKNRVEEGIVPWNSEFMELDVSNQIAYFPWHIP
jgi:hypothetical protein